jgi:hypothetical protein
MVKGWRDSRGRKKSRSWRAGLVSGKRLGKNYVKCLKQATIAKDGCLRQDWLGLHDLRDSVQVECRDSCSNFLQDSSKRTLNDTWNLVDV